MNNEPLHILLADDDEDDRIFFKDAIGELKIHTQVTTFEHGKELMQYLNSKEYRIPHLLFLDLNMPYKNGMECLIEIRAKQNLKDMAVAIYSTSASELDIEEAFVSGANIYIRKPNNFAELRRILSEVISINWQYHSSGMNKDNFILNIY